MGYDDYGLGFGYAFFAVYFFVIFLFSIAGYVLTSWFLMKIFDKAGVQGKWRAWVPVYNVMVFAKLGDLSPWIMLGAVILTCIPGLNTISWLVLVAATVMAALRVGTKLQKEWTWLLLGLIPGLGGLIWLGMNAFDGSRWNTAVAPAPWAANGFFADRTVWDGVPVQPVTAGPAYGAPQGYAAPQGYQPPQPGYGAPAQPGYPAAPTQPGYSTPQPGAPVPPAAPPATPPAPPAAPPAPPAAPPAPPTAEPPVDPTQPPA